MPSDQDLISECEFEDTWGVYVQPSGDLFQFNKVRGQPLDRVWTIVDSGDELDGNWYAQPGFHIVNKLGFVMTRKTWSDTTPDAIYFLDDLEHDDNSLT